MKLTSKKVYNDSLILFTFLAVLIFIVALSSILTGAGLKEVSFITLITGFIVVTITMIMSRLYHSKYGYSTITERKETNLYSNISGNELTLSETDAIKFTYNNNLYPIKLTSVDLDSEIDFRTNGEFIINRMATDDKNHFYTFNIDGNINLKNKDYRDLVAIVYSENSDLQHDSEDEQTEMNVMNFNSSSVPDVLYEAQDRLLRVRRIYTNNKGKLSEVWNDGDTNRVYK